MFSPLGLVELGSWVDPWTLLRKTALGRLPSLCPVAAPRFTGCRGYLQYGLELNWAGLAVSGSLAHGTGCSGARSGAVLQWEWRHWCCVILPLLATHVNTCDGPATFDPHIGTLASRQALVTPWDQRG